MKKKTSSHRYVLHVHVISSSKRPKHISGYQVQCQRSSNLIQSHPILPRSPRPDSTGRLDGLPPIGRHSLESRHREACQQTTLVADCIRFQISGWSPVSGYHARYHIIIYEHHKDVHHFVWLYDLYIYISCIMYIIRYAWWYIYIYIYT